MLFEHYYLLNSHMRILLYSMNIYTVTWENTIKCRIPSTLNTPNTTPNFIQISHYHCTTVNVWSAACSNYKTAVIMRGKINLKFRKQKHCTGQLRQNRIFRPLVACIHLTWPRALPTERLAFCLAWLPHVTRYRNWQGRTLNISQSYYHNRILRRLLNRIFVAYYWEFCNWTVWNISFSR